MALYEMRTYNVYVGRMAEVVKLYGDEGWPALENGGFSAKLVGYCTSDVGTLHQLVHLWKFDDDADRRNHWGTLFQNDAFMSFATQLRPLLSNQTVQLLNEAPWGPHP